MVTRALLILLGLVLTTNGFADEPEKWSLMQSAVLNEQNLDHVRALVASGVDPNAPIGCGTFAPLDGAITKDNVDMMALLLSLGAKPTDAEMVRAVSANPLVALKMVKMLQAAGASINAREYYQQGEDRFRNPIHVAVSKGDREMIAYLLGQKGIQLNNPGLDDDTPLMIAIEKGDPVIFGMLLAAGADPRTKNKKGLDAAAMAEGVIKKQRAFLAQLQAGTNIAAAASGTGTQGP